MVGFVHTNLEVVTGGPDGKVLHTPGNTSLELGQNDVQNCPPSIPNRWVPKGECTESWHSHRAMENEPSSVTLQAGKGAAHLKAWESGPVGRQTSTSSPRFPQATLNVKKVVIIPGKGKEVVLWSVVLWSDVRGREHRFKVHFLVLECWVVRETNLSVWTISAMNFEVHL